MSAGGGAACGSGGGGDCSCTSDLKHLRTLSLCVPLGTPKARISSSSSAFAAHLELVRPGHAQTQDQLVELRVRRGLAQRCHVNSGVENRGRVLSVSWSDGCDALSDEFTRPGCSRLAVTVGGFSTPSVLSCASTASVSVPEGGGDGEGVGASAAQVAGDGSMPSVGLSMLSVLNCAAAASTSLLGGGGDGGGDGGRDGGGEGGGEAGGEGGGDDGGGDGGGEGGGEGGADEGGEGGSEGGGGWNSSAALARAATMHARPSSIGFR